MKAFSLVDGFNGSTFTRDTQTETICVNNSAQTDKDWCVQLFDRLFERIDQVESKVIERLDRMEQRMSTLETSISSQPSNICSAVSEASSVLSDPHDFSQNDSMPRTPPTRGTPSYRRPVHTPRVVQRDMTVDQYSLIPSMSSCLFLGFFVLRMKCFIFAHIHSIGFMSGLSGGVGQ